MAELSLRQIMDGLLLYSSDFRKYQGTEDVLYPMLEKCLLQDESITREFIAKCSQDEFDHCMYCVRELSEQFGKPFLHWIIEHTEKHNLWNEYTEDMISEAVSVLYDERIDRFKDWKQPWLGLKNA